VTTLVASGEQGPSYVMVDSQAVYWDDYSAGLIRKVNLDGTGLTTLAGPAQGVETPLNMAMNPTNVYWPSRFARTIQTVAKNGTGADTLVTGASDPYAVAVDSSFVYWSNYADSTIAKAPLGGGAAIAVATSFSTPTAGGLAIAVDRANVYWTIQGPPFGPGGQVMFTPIGATGGQGTTLATSPDATWLTTDAACVYWVDRTDGNVRAVAKP
jgi:hypothetical protein